MTVPWYLYAAFAFYLVVSVVRGLVELWWRVTTWRLKRRLLEAQKK